MQIGIWDVTTVSAGSFRLDGGAMFGTVPKVVWSRLMPADELNRIEMACNCLLLRGVAGGCPKVVLVDSGNGDKEDETFRARMALQDEGALLRNLAAAGVQPGDVTDVVITHLHFDHAGGCTFRDAEGRLRPTFPRARHLVQAQELEDARHPHLRARGSYLAHNWQALEEAGAFVTLEGVADIHPGLRVRPFPGHNRGNQGVVVEGDGMKLVDPGDLFPTHHHLQPAWVMAYDMDVATCVAERLKLLDEITGTGAVLVFGHDPEMPAGTVQQNERGKYAATAVPL